jgi:cold shock CspA family protein
MSIYKDKVRFFDARKQLGFITPDDAQPDPVGPWST